MPPGFQVHGTFQRRLSKKRILKTLKLICYANTKP